MQARDRREYRYRIEMTDIDTDTASIGIDLELFWVPVSVSVSIWDFPESQYQSRYQLGATWVFGVHFMQNLADFHGNWTGLCSKSISISLGID